MSMRASPATQEADSVRPGALCHHDGRDCHDSHACVLRDSAELGKASEQSAEQSSRHATCRLTAEDLPWLVSCSFGKWGAKWVMLCCLLVFNDSDELIAFC